MELNPDPVERLLHQTICYAKLYSTKYWSQIDPMKYRAYAHEVASLEAAELVTATVAAQMGDEADDKSYGQMGNYSQAQNQGKVKNFRQWVKMEGGEIATSGIRGFVKTVDKLCNIIGGWITNLKLKWKLRNITPEHAMEQFATIKKSAEIRKQYGHDKVEGPEIPLLLKRLEGYVNICDTIHELAENSDEDAFDSDKTWDNFANSSNKALTTRPPKPGLFFRELERVEPYVKHFDLSTSEWCNESAVKELAKRIGTVKETVMEKIKDDLAFIKKITSDLQSDVTHHKAESLADATAGSVKKPKHNEEIDEMVVKYARSYVAAKFVTQLQDCFADECQYIVETLPKEFSPNWNDNRKHKKAEKEKAKQQPTSDQKPESNQSSEPQEKEKTEHENEIESQADDSQEKQETKK